jgi:hypothetical protein
MASTNTLAVRSGATLGASRAPTQRSAASESVRTHRGAALETISGRDTGCARLTMMHCWRSRAVSAPSAKPRQLAP